MIQFNSLLRLLSYSLHLILYIISLLFYPFVCILRMRVCVLLLPGRVAKWLERFTADRNSDSSSRTLRPKVGCSLCPPSSKWVPSGNTGEVKGGEERNWPLYFTMPTAQDKCPSNGHSPTYGIVYGTNLYILCVLRKLYHFLLDELNFNLNLSSSVLHFAFQH